MIEPRCSERASVPCQLLVVDPHMFATCFTAPTPFFRGRRKELFTFQYAAKNNVFTRFQ